MLFRPYLILFLVQLIDFIDSSFFPVTPNSARIFSPSSWSDVISTVGPKGEYPNVLKAAYKNSLEVMTKNNLRSIVRSLELAEKLIFPIHSQAFPCISTGMYGYPPVAACGVALTTVKAFLEKHHDKVVDFASWHISYSLEMAKNGINYVTFPMRIKCLGPIAL